MGINLIIFRARIMLSEFYITIEDFQSGIEACSRDLTELDGINHIQRHRMTDLGQDIVSFSEHLIRAHINATMWSIDDVYEVSRGVRPPNMEDLHAYFSGERELDPHAKNKVQAYLEDGQQRLERMDRVHKSRAAQRSKEAVGELKTCYKAYFFFIRAFHDACYGVLLNLNGRTPGDYSSMNRCIDKKVSPIFEKIVSLPGYIAWLKDFKKKRDQIKKGINFSLCGPQWDVGVGFTTVTPEGGSVSNVAEGSHKFRLGDLISALKYSIAIVELISQEIPRFNKALNAPASDAGAELNWPRS
jgi:hypothetical protein